MSTIISPELTPQSVADALAPIAPKWAKKIASEKLAWTKRSKLKLSESETCIVGEAYGFSNKYNMKKIVKLKGSMFKDNPDYCRICSEGGQDMFEEACPFKTSGIKPCTTHPSFLISAMKFAKHFKRTHKELLQR